MVGHALCYFLPYVYLTPAYLKVLTFAEILLTLAQTLSFPELLNKTYSHVFHLVNETKDFIEIYEISNESTQFSVVF
jgi:hypothetical protein